MNLHPKQSLQTNKNNIQATLSQQSVYFQMLAFYQVIIMTFFSFSVCNNNQLPAAIPFTVKQCQFFIIPPQKNFAFLYCAISDKPLEISWRNCIDSCCNGMTGPSYSTPNYDILTLCRKRTDVELSGESKILIVAISVAASFAFIGFILLFCKIFSSIFSNKITNQSIHNQQDAIDLSTNFAELKWIKVDEDQQLSKEIVCSICLQSSCYTQLCCNHLYHPQCIGSWLLKGKFCPNCHHSRIAIIKQYCYQCNSSYFYAKKGLFLNNLAKTKGLKCNHCLIKETKTEEKIITYERYQNNSKLEISKQSLSFAI